MTTNRDLSEDKPCGCCEGVQAITPVPILNRSGQDALHHRLGTHGAFMKTMLARLSSSKYPALAGLTTRDCDDPAIALLDAWATVADVLTFYQERIVNEGYLRTAQEQRSILELGRLVHEGDVLDTGRAASAYLAFELDPPAPGIDPEILIPKNTRAQTLPGQGELPQPFETTADLKACAEWNTLKPRMTVSLPPALDENNPVIYVKGTDNSLKPNDPILLELSNSTQKLYRVASVEPLYAYKCTELKLQQGKELKNKTQGGRHKRSTRQEIAKAYALRATASIFGHNAPLKPMLHQGSIIGYEEWNLTNARAGQFQRDELSIEITKIEGTKAKITAKVGNLEGSEDVEWPISNPLNIEVKENEDLVETVSVSAEPRFVFKNHATTFIARIAGGEIKKFDFYQSGQILPPDACWMKAPQQRLPRSMVAGASVLIQRPFIVEDLKLLYLNAVYPLIAQDSWVVIQKSTNLLIVTKTTAVTETSCTVCDISGRCTRLELADEWIESTDDFSVIRTSTVYTQSEELRLAEGPYTGDIQLDTNSQTIIELTGHCPNLEAGRLLIVAEEVVGTVDPVAEVAVLEHFKDEDGYSVLRLKPKDSSDGHSYRRDTVTIYANVVHALHGEAREEVLGSADASRPLQEFRLSHKPLSFIADATTTGVRSTLEVFVNDLRWHEVTRLSDFGPGDRVYVTARDEEDNITVRFGDGRHGLRPPTGVNNVTARYRTGLGTTGNVRAKQISQLVTRPLGVKGVHNPLPASGGDNRDEIADARWNVPLPVMALDRVVSLQDYEDFARAYTGIGKASAVYGRDDQNSLYVHLTIAGDDEVDVKIEDVKIIEGKCKNLQETLKKYGDQHLEITVVPCRHITLCLTANIALKPDYLWEKVEKDVRKALLEKLGFKQRALGQDGMLSEVMAVIQGIAGVAYVNMTVFNGAGDNTKVERVIVKGVQDEDNQGQPAQIAYFSRFQPEKLKLKELNDGRTT